MIWPASGTPVDSAIFGSLEPEEVLYDFDGPQIYISRSQGRPIFVYESDADDAAEVRRLLVVPTSEALISGLKTGRTSLCEALRQPWLHAVDQSNNGDVLNIWYLIDGLNSVPEDFKPVEGTLLSMELEQQRDNKIPEAAENMVTSTRRWGEHIRGSLRDMHIRTESQSGKYWVANASYQKYINEIKAEVEKLTTFPTSGVVHRTNTHIEAVKIEALKADQTSWLELDLRKAVGGSRLSHVKKGSVASRSVH